MWRPTAWSSFAAVVLLLNFGYVLAQTDDDPYNINRFNDLRLNEPGSLCRYLQCLSPLSPTTCPEGSIWMEKVAMYGCCGGCVRFITDTATECTGSMDIRYGGGYCDPSGCTEEVISLARTAGDPLNSTSFKASLRTTTDDADNNIIESSWCGYGLECKKSFYGGGNFCMLSSGGSGTQTSCIEAYNLLDIFMKSGEFDEFRDDYLYLPECTLKGLYKPMQCKGPIDEQRCMCVDPYGNNIFGSAYPFQVELYDTMNCECSRRVWEQQNEEGIESPTLHCLENGNYEPLQCENGYCYCIDTNTTEIYGPTVPEKAIFILPCYNNTLLGDNNKYLRLCESEYHAHITLGSFLRAKGMLEIPISSITCDSDGSYSGLYCDGTCNCVNKTGQISDELGRAINGEYGCNCKRDKELLANNGQTFKPLCRGGSGGYYDYRSDQNGAYCVDEQGIRSSPKVKQEFCALLSCTSAANCQKNGQQESDTYKNCNMACSYNNKPCAPCAYISYQEDDTAICDDYKIPETDNDKCTDPYYGNE